MSENNNQSSFSVSPELERLQNQFQEFSSSPEYKNAMANMVSEQIYDNLHINQNIIPDIPTPEERLKFLTSRMDSMNSELENQTQSMQQIQYENIKLNAQIEMLNKTIDSNKEELFELQKANAELKVVNKNLENSSRHYWRNTGLISLGIAIISYVLGLYSTEVKSLLLSILHLLQ